MDEKKVVEKPITVKWHDARSGAHFQNFETMAKAIAFQEFVTFTLGLDAEVQ